MDRLRIIPFEPEHLLMMIPREYEAREMLSLGDPLEKAREYLKYGPAFTGFINGNILACAGIIQLWRGVGEVWCATTSLVPSYVLSFHRAMVHGFETVSSVMGLWRIQTAIRIDHHISIKWAKRMGFEEEGTMTKYGPDGSNYLRLAKCLL